MQIKYTCPYWGSDRFSPKEFIAEVIKEGFSGAEMFLQPQNEFSRQFLLELENTRVSHPEFAFIALQLTFPQNESVDAYISKMIKNFEEIAAMQPDFINSHTGKDYYSFDDNCRIIEAAMNVGVKSGIRILHETHRGRFSFHAATLLPYLNKFPEMELVGDFSHFCTVSESMLEDQDEIIKQIIPHVAHIHARVGYEQGPQINDPAAPEWKKHLNQFIVWWQEIVDTAKNKNKKIFTVSPEFGPAPYMPSAPYTQAPLSNQWNNNVFMMNTLKQCLN